MAVLVRLQWAAAREPPRHPLVGMYAIFPPLHRGGGPRAAETPFAAGPHD